MARKPKKKGTSGAATHYISRRRACRKLQLSLKDFRRLCILKGIYPVEPKHRRHVNHGNSAHNTFYLVKDIKFIAHEPIIQKFRDFKIFIRRLRKAIGKNERDTAEHIRSNEPVYRVDHIVKERYPTFVDALRDIDDALSMCYLFSSFPKGKVVKPHLVHLCRRVIVEFMHYVIETRALRKVFVSIKGFYYQAEIMGQTITWIVPHNFSFRQPVDVDFKIMVTFTDFYVTLMGCVNYKLYHSLNLHYPPKLENEPPEPTNADDEDEVSERVASLNSKLKSVLTNAVADDAPQMDDFPDVEGESNKDIKNEEEKQKKFLNLFSGLKVFLGREVPRESLTFVLRSFGAEVSWDESLFVGSTFPENDPTVTHQIVDRPEIKKRFMNRYYVQPQWVYDCVNYRKLLPEQDYFMGEVLPPHLSPFVEEKEGDYVPPERLAMLRVQRGEEPVVSEEESMKEEGTAEDDGTAEEGKNSDDIPESEDEQDNESDGEESGDGKEEVSEEEEEESEDEEEVKKSASRKQRTKEAKKRKQPDAEFEPAVASKKPLIGVKAATVVREDPEKVAQRIKSEEKRLAVLMIPKKHKRLYDKIVFGQKRRAREAAALKQKREEIKKSSKKAKKK
ncbi:pescadillo homolog [Rhipicephalus microplus]|uniref:pescadillo homolog n=1 Tax=Rhipicephalus microplus TaxID=6941 RepID=UPI003F6C4095